MKKMLRDERGFLAAEAMMLALLFCGICLVVSSILSQGMLTAARSLNNELAGVSDPGDAARKGSTEQ